jgi:hypothetical protein
MARNRPRPFALAAAFAAAAMALVLSSNTATAQVVSLNTPGTYAGEFYQTPTIFGWTTNTQVSTFMGANGGTLASFQTAAGGGSSAFAPVTVVPPFPIPPWMANGPNSSWIGPTSNGAAGGAGTPPLAGFVNTGAGFSPTTSSPQGFLAYTTTFSLTGLPIGTSGLQWTSDNQGVAIYLNGKNEGDTNPGDFTTFTPFTLNTADFVVGVNTLTFVVFNEEFPNPAHLSPSGIRIEGSITTIPEPGTMVLAAVGALPFVGVALARRRRRTV